jgi:hypothetical protein
MIEEDYKLCMDSTVIHQLLCSYCTIDLLICVKVTAKSSCPEVNEYLSRFGSIQSLCHYSVPSKGKWSPSSGSSSTVAPTAGEFHWFLAEFERKEDLLAALDSAGYAEGTVPFISPMTLFHPRERPSASSRRAVKDVSSEVLGASSPPNFRKGTSVSHP